MLEEINWQRAEADTHVGTHPLIERDSTAITALLIRAGASPEGVFM
jgi:hypothetical protein